MLPALLFTIISMSPHDKLRNGWVVQSSLNRELDGTFHLVSLLLFIAGKWLRQIYTELLLSLSLLIFTYFYPNFTELCVFF